MLQVIWQWYGPFVNSFRRSYQLSPFTSGSFYQILRSTPLLGAYSSRVIPHPPDWPDSMQITGYWFQDLLTKWQPPAQLEAFLEAGDPPVYIGFGSMAGSQPDRLAKLVLEALAMSGQRGLLLTGWGGIHALSVPESVLVIEAAPHTWLFPRMAAVVHHGGAGTTAEGLRAGVPSVILPYMMDQPFWGQRVKALGVGPEPVLQKKLTSDSLAGAICAAVMQPEIKRRAVQLSEAICTEDGVANAVKIVKQHLERD
jgi:sterol 3beta-glucosyltransferase